MGNGPLEGGTFDQASSTGARVDYLAVRVREGDSEARDELYELIAPRINRFAEHWRGSRLPAGYDMDDLHQEAYLAFGSLVREWRQDKAFYPYFLTVFPKRLHRLIWQLSAPWRHAQVDYVDHHKLVQIADAVPHDEGIDAQLCLSDLLERLPKPLSLVAHRHLTDGVPLSQFAREADVSRKVAASWASSATTRLRGMLEACP